MQVDTSTERNKQLVLEHYRATVSEVDLAAIREQISPEFVDHESPRGTAPGAEWVVQHVASFHKAFPDIRIEVHEAIAERDLVVVRATWSGTHRGDYMGHAATQREFKLKGMVMWRVHEGRIVERWGCLDRLGLMQQLGLMAAGPKYDYVQSGGNGGQG